jgi:hypothetical protein
MRVQQYSSDNTAQYRVMQLVSPTVHANNQHGLMAGGSSKNSRVTTVDSPQCAVQKDE